MVSTEMNDDAFDKTCIISPGLEILRVRSFITQVGARSVILISFRPTGGPLGLIYPDALLTQLSQVRSALVESLTPEVQSVETRECSELSTAGVAEFLLNITAELRAAGKKRVIVGIGTGHTLFKLGAFLAASLDQSIELKYGHATDYLEVHAVRVAKAFASLNPADQEALGGLGSALRGLAQFAAGGGSGPVVAPSNIATVEIRAPSARELEVLKALEANGGQHASYLGLARAVQKQRGDWKDLADHTAGARKGPTRKRGDTAAMIAGELRSTTVNDLERRGFVSTEKRSREVHIALTESGRLVCRLLGHSGRGGPAPPRR